MNKGRIIACLAAILLFTLLIAIPAVTAVTPSVQAPSTDNALELLIIELFFLLIGLFVIAVLGYLIWESRRKKKTKKQKIGKQ